jgi:hypothetical protein
MYLLLAIYPARQTLDCLKTPPAGAATATATATATTQHWCIFWSAFSTLMIVDPVMSYLPLWSLLRTMFIMLLYSQKMTAVSYSIVTMSGQAGVQYVTKNQTIKKSAEAYLAPILKWLTTYVITPTNKNYLVSLSNIIQSFVFKYIPIPSTVAVAAVAAAAAEAEAVAAAKKNDDGPSADAKAFDIFT